MTSNEISENELNRLLGECKRIPEITPMINDATGLCVIIAVKSTISVGIKTIALVCSI